MNNHISKFIISFVTLFIITASFLLPFVSHAEPAIILEGVSAGHNYMDVKVNILTGGETIGLKVKYGIQPGVYDEETAEFYRGSTTGTTSTSATAHMLDLTPNTDYYFGIVNSDTGVEYISSFNPTTPSAGQTLESGGGASSTATCVKGQYCLLAPLPGLNSYDVKKGNVGEYLNILFKIGIGIAGVLAVVMLVLGGIQYMSSDSISEKGTGRERMTNAIIGLILALGSIVILKTLNTNLAIIKLNIDEVQIDVENADTNDPVGPLDTQAKADLAALGIDCPGTGGVDAVSTIAQSFNNKVTYGYGSKGEAGPSNTVKLDCSGYVNRVLQCANVQFVNSGTSGIFQNAEKVNKLTATTVNDIPLQNGDLLGWTSGDGEKYGHVLIYIGNGKVMDSHGPTGVVGKAVDTWSTEHYKNRIKFIKRAR
jgi:hypothetical protein